MYRRIWPTVSAQFFRSVEETVDREALHQLAENILKSPKVYCPGFNLALACEILMEFTAVRI